MPKMPLTYDEVQEFFSDAELEEATENLRSGRSKFKDRPMAEFEWCVQSIYSTVDGGANWEAKFSLDYRPDTTSIWYHGQSIEEQTVSNIEHYLQETR